MSINQVLLQETKSVMTSHRNAYMTKPYFTTHIDKYGEHGIKELISGQINPAMYRNEYE